MNRVAIWLIGLYQRFLSPILPAACRFHPTCSEYARLSFQTQPFWLACWKSLRRLLRCHPFHPGGVDLP